MTSIEGFASDLIGPCSPHCERTARTDIPIVQRASGTPEGKDRTGYAPARRAIFTIMFMIDCCGRAVLLANRMRANGITERFDIRFADF